MVSLLLAHEKNLYNPAEDGCDKMYYFELTLRAIIFRRVRIVAESACYLRNGRPYARMYRAAAIGRISVKFGIGGLRKIRRENPKFVKIGQK
jgi:hypothetical protein